MLKRVIVIFIILTFSASTVVAENGLGVMLGLLNANMTGVENSGTKADGKWCGTFGLFMKYQIAGFFFIHPAFFLTWKGFTKNHLISNNPINILQKPTLLNGTQEMTEDVLLGYLQVPVLISYEIPVEGKYKPRILLGPTFSFNISAKDEASGFGTWDGKHNIGNVKTLDIGGMIGLGLSFPIDKFTFGVDVLYDMSFSSAFADVTEEELANDVNEELWTKTDPVTYERTTEAVDFKNTGLSIQVNMMLPIEF